MIENYRAQTPTEIAYDMITYINEYCRSNNITNSKGELIYIDINPTNPLYMICFGVSYLIGLLQKMIYKVSCSFNINSASNKQLLNLANIIGVKRRNQTRTTIDVLVYASLTNACTIPVGTTITTSIEGSNVVFETAFELNVEAGTSKKVIMVAQTEGSYSIAADTYTSFDTEIENLRMIKQSASVPGQQQETIEAFRKRLQQRNDTSSSLDKCIDAIESLEGVSLCNIIQNFSISAEQVVNGLTIPPRQTLVIVQGYNEHIGETYWKYMTSQTSNEKNDRAITQYYTTRAGQKIPCAFLSPVVTPFKVRVYINTVLIDPQKQAIKDTLLVFNSTLKIGQELSTADITSALRDTYKNFDIQTAELSLDEDVYTYKVSPESDALLTLKSDDITIYSKEE